MTQADNKWAPKWSSGTLYKALWGFFPEHRSKRNTLDIWRLAEELGKSHESIYKWLRSGKLTPKNANALLELANEEENKKALAKLGLEPPELADFIPFAFATTS